MTRFSFIDCCVIIFHTHLLFIKWWLSVINILIVSALMSKLLYSCLFIDPSTHHHTTQTSKFILFCLNRPCTMLNNVVKQVNWWNSNSMFIGQSWGCAEEQRWAVWGGGSAEGALIPEQRDPPGGQGKREPHEGPVWTHPLRAPAVFYAQGEWEQTQTIFLIW